MGENVETRFTLSQAGFQRKSSERGGGDHQGS